MTRPHGGGRGSAACILYTSDAADEGSSVDLGGRRITKKKEELNIHTCKDRQYSKQPMTTKPTLTYTTTTHLNTESSQMQTAT